MLQTHRLTKRYAGRVALDALTLDLPERCFVALLGPNGAGKSTLFQLLTGLFAADEGEAVIAGHSLRSHATRARSAAWAWSSSSPRSISTSRCAATCSSTPTCTACRAR